MRSNEEWRPVVGLATLYEVSSFGRVRSTDRVRRQPIGFGPNPRTIVARHLKGKLLIPSKVKSGGYLSVALSDGASGVRRRKVHQLVLAAFVGPCPRGLMPLHGDGNPTNNRLTNLRYGSAVENIADAKRHGTFRIGSRCSFAKLGEADAARIKSLLCSRSVLSLAREYGVSRGCIAGIRNGRNWKHVDPALPELNQRRAEGRDRRGTA